MLEQQAMDRVHRTGQTKPVNVVKLSAEHTIEQRILELQARPAPAI
jgi:SNF2 family DNA or RNA helicase